MAPQNSRQRPVYINNPEAELLYDVLIKSNKLFTTLRLNFDGSSPEQFERWIKTHQKFVVSYCEMLEEMALDIGKPELYSDSPFLAALKDKILREESNPKP